MTHVSLGEGTFGEIGTGVGASTAGLGRGVSPAWEPGILALKRQGRSAG
jgi:hypothetical protein